MTQLQLITDEETLRRYLVNSVRPVDGERPMLDRLTPHVLEAEDYLQRTVTGRDFELLPPEGPAYDAACDFTAMRALASACRALDVVMTPNGFGVVSTPTIAPASRERVDSFRRESVTAANRALSRLLRLLSSVEVWVGSEQFRYFRRSTFPGMLLCENAADDDEDWTEVYPRLVEKVRLAEDELAVRYISAPLMSRLRREYDDKPLTEPERHVAGAVRGQALAHIKGGAFNSEVLSDIVEYIRRRPADFPQWAGSETARLWVPPVFCNDMKSGGYFF